LTAVETLGIATAMVATLTGVVWKHRSEEGRRQERLEDKQQGDVERVFACIEDCRQRHDLTLEARRATDELFQREAIQRLSRIEAKIENGGR